MVTVLYSKCLSIEKPETIQTICARNEIRVYRLGTFFGQKDQWWYPAFETH